MSVTAQHAATLESALLKACRLDVVAFKPGNVSLCSAGHGMYAADFLLSARAAVPALCVPGRAVGERIEQAVRRSFAAVHCNTNLGIVLLLAPLAAATEQHSGSLRSRLHEVLANLDIADSEHCYRAIRLASPGGLGAVEQEDVHAPARLDLRASMGLARTRDLIAAQYCNDFECVFECGLPILREYRLRWRSLAWASVACYLEILARQPDSHVARKGPHGVAEAVSRQAGTVAKAFKACENPRLLADRLIAFDRELKKRGVNPGTSADLTVASVAVLLLQDRFHLE